MEEMKVTWPGWEVVRKIGSGSFGSVYEIRRDMFGDVEKAALKVIHIPQNRDEIQELRSLGYDDASITTHFKGYLEDIVREYSLMNKMKGHTNVVYCDDIRYEHNPDGIGWDIYIKMELLTPLMNNLAAVSTEEQVVRLGMDLCSALVLCKERNIVHRDIKPQNIFMSDTGDFKLGDFGVAKTVERTTGGTKIGTYKYMAPEVYNNQPYGHSSDIYALGLVLYWLLNEKRTPFLPMPPQIPTAAMEDAARLRRFTGEEIPAPAYGNAELQRIVLKACAFDPKDRYASAADMLAELKALQPSSAPVATAVPLTGTAATATAATAKIPRPAEEEGTVNIFSKTAKPAEEAPTEYLREDKTEYIRDDKTEYIPRSAPAQEPPKKKKGWLIPVIAGVVAIVIILLLLRSCGGGSGPATEPFGTTTGVTTTAPTTEATTAPTTQPTTAPTTAPTTEPTTVPTTAPATEPTTAPTTAPTEPPVTEAPKVTVPNVAGKTEAAATAELKALGLSVSVGYEKNDSVAEGNVIRQSVAAGSQIAKGSSITLTVSSGKPTISVANVVGKTQAAATSTLQGQGFKVSVTQEYSATVAAGTVISQDPPAGSGRFSGDTVTIVVSKGPIVPTGVSLSKSSATLQIYGTLQLTATVSPSNAHDKSLTWSSSNTAVATVSADGLVTAKGPGTATITVKTNSGGKTATCTVTVSNPTIGSISNQTMFIGDSKSVSLPAVTPSSTLVTNFGATSSNNAAVTVALGSSWGTPYIELKAVAAGTATITVSYTAGGATVKTTFTVTVNTPKVTLSSYSGTLSWNMNSNDDTPDLYTLSDHTPCWPAALPTATSNTGSSIYWKVTSGKGSVSGSKVYLTNPGEKVVVQAYFTYNGVTYSANYTVTLSLTKYTTAANNLRKGHGTSYGTYTSIPKGKTVTITEVWYDYSTRNSEGNYYAWGKVTYGGYTGWVVIK